MTDQELRDLVAENSRAIDLLSKESEKDRIAADKRFKETDIPNTTKFGHYHHGLYRPRRLLLPLEYVRFRLSIVDNC